MPPLLYQHLISPQQCFIFTDLFLSLVHPGAWRFNRAKLSLITFYAYADRPALSTGRLIHWQCFIIKATPARKTYIKHFIFIFLLLLLLPLPLLPHSFCLPFLQPRTLSQSIVVHWRVQVSGRWGIIANTKLVLTTNAIVGFKNVPLSLYHGYHIRPDRSYGASTQAITTSTIMDSYISIDCPRSNSEPHRCFCLIRFWWLYIGCRAQPPHHHHHLLSLEYHCCQPLWTSSLHLLPHVSHYVLSHWNISSHPPPRNAATLCPLNPSAFLLRAFIICNICRAPCICSKINWGISLVLSCVHWFHTHEFCLWPRRGGQKNKVSAAALIRSPIRQFFFSLQSLCLIESVGIAPLSCFLSSFCSSCRWLYLFSQQLCLAEAHLPLSPFLPVPVLYAEISYTLCSVADKPFVWCSQCNRSVNQSVYLF